MHPPEHAEVICVDEKTSIQALDRTKPSLPMHPGQVERRTHDYVRHGVIDLFAALNIATGQVIARTDKQHRAVEFIKFLDAIDANVPADLDVHVVIDNASTHKTPAVHKWQLRHPRFTFHFTPTSSSWLNLVERWFGELTDKKLRRSAHRSVKELTTDLEAWVNTWNENPRPFVWTKTADEILDKLKRYLTIIQQTSSEASPRTAEMPNPRDMAWPGYESSPFEPSGCSRLGRNFRALTLGAALGIVQAGSA
jgi:transposase